MRFSRAGAESEFQHHGQQQQQSLHKQRSCGTWTNTDIPLVLTYFQLVFLTSCQSEALYLVAQVVLEEEDSSDSETDAR